MDDLVVRALSELVPGGVRRGELRHRSRILRWVEAGSGAPVVVLDAALGEPGSLAWAGVLPAVATHARVIAYDRAGTGVSHPVSPLTLDTQVGDLTALITKATSGRCVLAGHSLGGLLAQLTALSHPRLIAGLVLVDPADENFRAALPPEDHREIAAMGTSILNQHSRGDLGNTTRDTFRPFAQRLTPDPQLQALILDAYAWCYAKRSQALMIQDENQLYTKSLLIRRTRASATLPDVPVVVLSATTGMPEDQRETFTNLHADLAASVPRGTHVVLADIGHHIIKGCPSG